MKKNETHHAPVKSVREKVTQLEKIASRIEAIRLGDYIATMNRPVKIIWVNLLGGIAKGVGFTLGATVVIVIVFKILSMIVNWNVPYLSEIIRDILAEARGAPGTGGYQQMLPVVSNASRSDGKPAGVAD